MSSLSILRPTIGVLLVIGMLQFFCQQIMAEKPWNTNENLEVTVEIKESSRSFHTKTTETVTVNFTNTQKYAIEMKALCGDSILGDDREIFWGLKAGETFGKPVEVENGEKPTFTAILWRKAELY